MPYLHKSRKKKPVKNRKPPVNYYNSRIWTSLRLSHIKDNPICEYCLTKGRTSEMNEVHHILPIMGVDNAFERKKRAYDPDNLLSVCSSCHIELHSILEKSPEKYFNLVKLMKISQ